MLSGSCWPEVVSWAAEPALAAYAGRWNIYRSQAEKQQWPPTEGLSQESPPANGDAHSILSPLATEGGRGGPSLLGLSLGSPSLELQDQCGKDPRGKI